MTSRLRCGHTTISQLSTTTEAISRRQRFITRECSVAGLKLQTQQLSTQAHFSTTLIGLLRIQSTNSTKSVWKGHKLQTREKDQILASTKSIFPRTSCAKFMIAKKNNSRQSWKNFSSRMNLRETPWSKAKTMTVASCTRSRYRARKGWTHIKGRSKSIKGQQDVIF